MECPAELPIEMTAFKTQQARWAKGLIQCAIKDLPKVMHSNVNRREKIEAWYHLTANISYPLMIMLSVLLLPAMVIRFYQGWFQMLYIDVPLFLASTFSISSFYLVSQKELFPRHWLRTFLYLPCLMALGIGLTITNSKAVIEALIGKQTAFARTPKYRVQNKSDQSVAAKKYRKRLGIVPWIELAIGCYFAMTVVYAVQNENYITDSLLDSFRFRLLVHRHDVAATGKIRRHDPLQSGAAHQTIPGGSVAAEDHARASGSHPDCVAGTGGFFLLAQPLSPGTLGGDRGGHQRTGRSRVAGADRSGRLSRLESVSHLGQRHGCAWQHDQDFGEGGKTHHSFSSAASATSSPGKNWRGWTGCSLRSCSKANTSSRSSNWINHTPA